MMILRCESVHVDNDGKRTISFVPYESDGHEYLVFHAGSHLTIFSDSPSWIAGETYELIIQKTAKTPPSTFL